MILQDIINTYKILKDNTKQYYGRIGYAANKNISILENEIKAYEASRSMSEEIKEYESLRIELCKTHAKKDENGNPKYTDDGTSFVIDNYENFHKEVMQIHNKYATHINEHNLRIAASDKMLSEDIKIDLFKIKVSEEEISKLNGEALKGIMEFIELT